MNARERLLATVVGGLMVVLLVQYGISSYRDASQSRRNRLDTLRDEIDDKEHAQLLGAMADATMADYRERSLPSDPQQARSQYSDWLLRLIGDAGLEESSATFQSALNIGDLYRQYTFQLRGKGSLSQIVRVLYGFHSRDYLHRIRRLSISPTNQGNQLLLDLTIEAIALDSAAEDQPPPEEPAPRARRPLESFMASITERNMFSPPNQPPRFAGDERPRAEVGRESTFTAEFRDPDEGQSLRYALAGEVPENVAIDEESGRIRIEPAQLGPLELTVRATDDGLPAQSAEQRLVVEVVEPPPSEEEPEFDPAAQAVLTGLVRSGDRWTAWINVRTEGELLRVGVGDEIDVGTVQGTVVEITDRFAVVESDDRQWTLRPQQSLAEASKASDEAH